NLLFQHDFLHKALLLDEFIEHALKLLGQKWYQLVDKRGSEAKKSIGIAYRTAQDTPDNIPRLVVRRKLSVRYRKTYRTYMIRQYTHGDIRLFVGTVCGARPFSDKLYHRLENIGVVI